MPLVGKARRSGGRKHSNHKPGAQEPSETEDFQEGGRGKVKVLGLGEEASAYASF